MLTGTLPMQFAAGNISSVSGRVMTRLEHPKQTLSVNNYARNHHYLLLNCDLFDPSFIHVSDAQ